MRSTALKNKLYTLLFLFLLAGNAFAQAPKKLNAAEILQGLKKLNVVGSAL